MEGVEIFVEKGKKPQSPYDFKVRYKEPSQRERTPKHIHWIIDLYIKRENDRDLTNQLIDHLIDMTGKLKPATAYPPRLQIYKEEHHSRFAPLNNWGEYSVEFLLVTIELIMIQEKTNYPCGTINLELLKSFRREDPIFQVVSRATFRR
jgi:hypothetical protein